MRVLIGYDGSEHSNAALDDLKRAGLPKDSAVLVVSVGDLLMSSPPIQEAAAQIITSPRVASGLKNAQMHAERVIGEAEQFASKAADRLGLEFPGWNVESRVVTGTPAWELIDAANDWNANLVVVGSTGRSAIGRLFLGSVSKRVVTDSRCSVRVARCTKRRKENKPPKIIIGIDGSAAAEAAVHEVGRRVWQEGTQIRLMVARDQPLPVGSAVRMPQAAGMLAGFDRSAAERADSMLDWAAYQLKSIGLNVSISIQKSDPKRLLLNEAVKWNADCIFVGTHDFKNSLERFRLGSVSTAVVTNASCSVEIVRPAEKQED
jgi:nucleotide-binding universal stress UspA family protein